MPDASPLTRERPRSRDEIAASLRHLMDTEGPAVAENTRGFNEGRYQSLGRLPNVEALRDEARQIKERAIEQLPRLVEQVQEAVEARGGTVTVAEDAAAANARIRELTQGARRVVKSKSMTTEEIEVNEHLEAAGLDVVETDLAEWVLQLADEASSHLVVPAMHKSREEIARLVNRTFDLDPPLETPEELTRFARTTLWQKIRAADVGMTGANFITADTGTLALVTSEGNARKSVLLPPTYIAVAGVEKILPRVEDLQPFLELIGRSGTGQDLTSYVSLLTPPFDTPVRRREEERPPEHQARSFHLVLIDNGRLAMRDDSQLRETLYCIRCGACSNVCANFQQVGGHAFGGETYSGGIATGWEAGIHGPEGAASFNDLCTGCSRCVPACPVKIDIPWINTVVRDRLNQGREPGTFDHLVDGLLPDAEPEPVPLARRAVAHFETLARWGSRTAPVSNWISQWSPVRRLMERVVGIDRRRALPAFQRETLRAWMRNRDGAASGAPDVLLVPDTYTNFVWTRRGKAAVRVLEALGLEVGLAPVGDLGRPALSQGMIATATERAEQAATALDPHLDAGRPVLFVEPTDLAMAKREYEKLLPAETAERLGRAARDVMEVVGERLASLEEGRRDGRGGALLYHSHCQQRTLDLAGPTIDVLERLGYDVTTTAAECCGMAGSFGYKAEYYELSMRVGADLEDEIRAQTSAETPLVASGVSCREQLDALFDRGVRHPIEVVDATLSGANDQ